MLVDLSIEKGHQVYALQEVFVDQPQACEWIKASATEPENYLDSLPETINALTFCPGKVILGPIKRLRPEQMLEAYQTSVLDAFSAIQSLLPRLSGSIVLLSSVAARTGLPNHCAISAAKSALEGFAIALAADLAPKVRVNVVAPTLTPTEMGTAMVGGEKMLPMIEERHPLKKFPRYGKSHPLLLFFTPMEPAPLPVRFSRWMEVYPNSDSIHDFGNFCTYASNCLAS